MILSSYVFIPYTRRLLSTSLVYLHISAFPMYRIHHIHLIRTLHTLHAPKRSPAEPYALPEVLRVPGLPQHA